MSETWKLFHTIVTAATPEQVLLPTEVGDTISAGSLCNSDFHGVNEESEHFKLYAHKILTLKEKKLKIQ